MTSDLSIVVITLRYASVRNWCGKSNYSSHQNNKTESTCQCFFDVCEVWRFWELFVYIRLCFDDVIDNIECQQLF